MKNKRVKQMICDAIKISCKCNCGEVFWDSIDYENGKYPNSIIIVDGMYDMESAFWYSPSAVSLTANQLKGK